jgi:hypothetical protein
MVIIQGGLILVINSQSRRRPHNPEFTSLKSNLITVNVIVN